MPRSSALVRFVALGAAFTFSSLGHSPIVGAVLVVLFVVGIVATVRATSPADVALPIRRTRSASVGAAAFLVIVGFGRADDALPGSETYAASRYLYIAAALVLPALVVVASQLATTWKVLWPVVIVVLVIGVPGNITILHRSNYLHTLDAYRQMFLTLPRLPIASSLPRSIHPDPDYDGWVTMGWLIDGVRDGRIPPPSPEASPGQKAFSTLRLAWQPSTAAPEDSCHPVALPADVRVHRGTRLTVNATVTIAYQYGPHLWSAPIQLFGDPQSQTYISYWPMTVRITPTVPEQTVSACAGGSR